MIKLRKMRRARHVERMGDRRDAYRFLVEIPEEKRPLGDYEDDHHNSKPQNNVERR